jgi:type 1 glutamine amidotransferase
MVQRRTTVENEIRKSNRTVGMAWAGALVMLLAVQTMAQTPFKVLVFRGFFGYENSALVTATTVLKDQLPTLMSSTPAFTVDTAISPSIFTAAKLAPYQVLVLNNNTGLGGLTTAQRQALTDFTNTKGVVGLHSTADFKGGASWPEMVSYIGGSLDGHTADMGTLRMETTDLAKSHPINAGLPATARMNDEWYGYSANPRKDPSTLVLWNIDESSLTWSAGSMGGDHPIAWCKSMPGGGRMFYTAQAHRDSIMEKNAQARRLVYNAILWVAKATPTQIAVTPSAPREGFSMQADRSSLQVTFAEKGAHFFKVCTLSGRQVAARKGQGEISYSIPGLKSGAIYIISGKSAAGSFAKKVTVP